MAGKFRDEQRGRINERDVTSRCRAEDSIFGSEHFKAGKSLQQSGFGKPQSQPQARQSTIQDWEEDWDGKRGKKCGFPGNI